MNTENNKNNDNLRPVGIFDSGLGGLSSVREALKILPGENIVYFGDTGRVPYGSRSYDIIQKYARQDVNFLISKDVKMILISCGTVSSVAIDYLHEEFPDIPVIGVVESACKKAAGIVKTSGNKKIGVIGTQATISTGAFENYINTLDNSCEVYGQACPLFVPLVENGYTQDDNMITKLVAEEYLNELKDLNLSSLILGCTHYPMIKNTINEIINNTACTQNQKNNKNHENHTILIDVGFEAAYRLKQELLQKNLLNNIDKKGQLDIYISDEGQNFKNIASAFLGFDIKSDVVKIDIEKY